MSNDPLRDRIARRRFGDGERVFEALLALLDLCDSVDEANGDEFGSPTEQSWTAITPEAVRFTITEALGADDD
jgi:hypothetical protein